MKHELFRFLCSALLIALMLAALGPVRPAYAASYVVNSLDDAIANDGACTLREAIQEANNGTDTDCTGSPSNANDTIVFSVSGTITLSSTLPNIVSGQGTLTIDGGGNITISGDNAVRVMSVDSGANLSLQNLTIANGLLPVGGAGVYNAGGTVNVTNSTFSGNSGGGIWNANGGTLTVTGSTFSGNSASGCGGGICNSGPGATLNVSNSTFSGNSSGVTFGGGGVHNAGGTVNVTNSTFSGNSAGSAGGIFNSGPGATLNVSNSTFSGNSANGGGGISNDLGATLTVTNSTFSGNSANGSGGGISNNGTLNVSNSAFSGNSANGSGGGIANSGGTLTVFNSTFSANSAGAGGGIYVASGAATLKNTIIANSTSGGDCVNSVPLSGTNNNNLIEDTGLNACNLSHGLNSNIIGFDPNLGALTGSPAYFPLNPGSPAIDSGDNATCAAAPVNNQSQNGVTRPKDGDNNGTAVCDIGSYEKGLALLYLYLPLIVR